MSAPATVWTIGHSTRTPEEFLALLAAYSIKAVADPQLVAPQPPLL